MLASFDASKRRWPAWRGGSPTPAVPWIAGAWQPGRLLAHTSRAAGRYVIDLVADPSVPAGVLLVWTARPEWDDWARWSEGATCSAPTSRTGVRRS